MRSGKKQHTRKRGYPLDILLSMPYELLSLVWLFSTMLFAGAYFYLSYFLPAHAPTELGGIADPLFRFLDALYFSIITATSTGFGDIVPQGISKGLAALQSMSSIVVLALFVAKFAASRQEAALEEIHELSFDSAFHTIRQGLFIARKDLDRAIEKAQTERELSQKDWRNLYIAFHQMQIFIKQIPTLYNVEHRRFELGVDRERLLLDSVERTLRRALESLVFFAEVGIAVSEHAGSVKELYELSALVQRMFRVQKEKTTDIENREAFDEVLNRADEIYLHLERV